MRIPKVRWQNTLFLLTTFLATLIAVPLYIMQHGLPLYQVGLFLGFFILTGLSITLGYHRYFAHLTFEASWPVKLATLLFGAAAFEGSAMSWAADHRRHHKHVDQDEDPYDISKGLFFAHIGWLLFRNGPDTPLSWVRDLQKDRLAVWQHRYYVPLAFGVGFGLPALIGFLIGGWVGALGSFLIAGVARVVAVHHMTFCINSLCHWLGTRPYSRRSSARDSAIMALFTFGEGYHNYHHTFQHDYRNGVKAWHWDPTKWTIWTLHKLGLVRKLRRVPDEKVLRAQFAEQERHTAELLSQPKSQVCEDFPPAAADRRHELSRSQYKALRRQLDEARDALRDAIGRWQLTYQA